MNNLVSCEWLQNNIDLPNLIILDASTTNNKSGSLSLVAMLKVPNSRKIDIKSDFSDKSSEFPNMLLSTIAFEKSCQNLGINTDSIVIVYDNLGIYTSPRVWWMFKVMGHKNISVLNGGLPEWVRLGFETQSIESNHVFDIGNFVSNYNNHLIEDFNAVLLNVKLKKKIVIDARSEGRFKGTVSEPRKGLMGGCISDSYSLPYSKVLKDGKYLPVPELKMIFDSFLYTSKPLIFSCGSGITACILYLAVELVSDVEKSVFDGSWTEWATRIQND